jgi:glycosidase
MMTIPGIPVIYYGDEIGDPGGNDPDNRRMMRFENLSDQEQLNRATTEKLVHLRRNSMALLFGDFNWLATSEKIMSYRRSYFQDQVWVVFNKSAEVQKIDIGEVPASTKTNFTGKIEFENKQATLTLNPHSFEILTSSTSN